MEKKILLGNEAIVRAALEAGVQFVATYPGTPASEIGNNFFHLSQKQEYKGWFEFSTNEKVALEAGIGASFSGLKTLVAMKNFGMNVALESLLPLAYTGTKGAMVIVVADDPNCWSSAQSEENSRAFALLSHLPMLEPSDSQECLDFTKLAFQISEKFNLPVLLRTTTRVNHQKAIVRLGELAPYCAEGSGVGFVRDQKRFVTLPPRALEMKKELLEKVTEIRQFSEKSSLNQVVGGRTSANAQIGIIASGVSYLYVMEALAELNLNLPVLKIGIFYPLAEKKIEKFIKGLKKVLVVEELEPYLEKEIERLAKNANPKLEILGKKLLPEIGEMKPEYVISAIAKITNKRYKLQTANYKPPTIKHLPRFCAGCPYWSVFEAVKKTGPKNTVFGGDIGCYMLGGISPHNLYDYLSCMGSSIGIGHGIAKATNITKMTREANVTKETKAAKIIAFIGDSTFFHAGIPALINSVFNKSDILLIILDNGTTAMTGHQPNPGTSIRENSEYKFDWQGYEQSSPKGENPVSIEGIVKACGVKNLKVVNAFNLKEMLSALDEFLAKKETSVIVARGMCALFSKSLKK